MKRAYKYKIKPTTKQQQMLSQFFGCVRFIYNWGLDRKVKTYKEEKKNVTYIQIAKELTLLKQQEETKWLQDCANECLQQSLRCLDNAYTGFFKAKKGFPKFKSKHKSKDVCKFINAVHFDFDKWRVKIPKVGWTKLCPNKSFDLSKCKLGTLTVSRDKCGEYWCTIIVENDEPNRPKAKVCEETSVGIDLGIKYYAMLSDGTKYGNPKFLEKWHKHFALLQKRFARSKKDSKRHERLRYKIAKQHRRIANQRNDFLHKLSTLLISRYDTICLENLNVDGMLKNHHLANSIQSASWSEFVRQLTYKAEWYGKNLVFIGRFEPSSKTCSKCGYVKNDLQLSDREWVCPKCGTHHDRDVNAARNIKQMGLHPQALVGIENKIPEVTGIMDGEGNVIGHPMKRQDNKSCMTYKSTCISLPYKIYEIYNGKSGGAYRASRYLAEAISSKGKTPIYSNLLAEGIQFEPSEHNKGGIIVFSMDVNAEKQSENRFINFLKQKMKTISNRFNATKKIDKIAAKNELVGWTIGHYLDGRYTSPKNGKQYGEKSLSLEIIGVDFEKLYTIAMEICDSFSQESVLLKDFSSGRVLFVDKS